MEGIIKQAQKKRKRVEIEVENQKDVSVKEAFELYLLKHFHNLKLTKSSEEILGFWEKAFEKISG